MKKKKATPAQLAEWRIGHHIEAAGKMIAGALNRIADQMERDHQIKAAEVNLRREHLLTVLDQRETTDKLANKFLSGFQVRDLRVTKCRCAETDGKDCPIPFHQPAADEGAGPEWVRDVLADADAHTERQ